MPHLEKTDLLSTTWVMAGAYTLPKPYPEGVEQRLGGNTGGFLKLFMVPGMYQCGGGPGATTFDTLGRSTRGYPRAKHPIACWPRTRRTELQSFPDRYVPTRKLGGATENIPSAPLPSFNCVLPEKRK